VKLPPLKLQTSVPSGEYIKNLLWTLDNRTAEDYTSGIAMVTKLSMAITDHVL